MEAKRYVTANWYEYYILKYTTPIQFHKARTHTFIFGNLCARLAVNELIRIWNTLMPSIALYEQKMNKIMECSALSPHSFWILLSSLKVCAIFFRSHRRRRCRRHRPRRHHHCFGFVRFVPENCLSFPWIRTTVLIILFQLFVCTHSNACADL